MGLEHGQAGARRLQRRWPFDQAVFDSQGGYWYIKTLSGTVLAWQVQWGWSTAIPVSGDFNGDGKYDLAVYDSATGLWYVRNLSGGVIAWGSTGAGPVPRCRGWATDPGPAACGGATCTGEHKVLK
jgi:hypothetical protein